MATIDHKAELSRAGAGVSGFWGTTYHLARRYPLGAAGALIVLLFVGTAIFADYLTAFDPTSTSARSSLAQPSS
jgi:peptide/nickel transport system permease protein